MRCVLSLLGTYAAVLSASLSAQQIPFIPVSGPNAPTGATYLFQDHEGGLWLGGNEGFRGLRYFDGNRFTTPIPEDFGKIISEIAEDGDGGIWLASPTQGLYRVSHGRMQKMVDNRGLLVSVASIARNLLLGVLEVPDKSGEFTLTRIVNLNGIWKAEAMTSAGAGIHATPDGSGNVLYPCDDGYCEVRISDVKNWRAGTKLSVKHHSFGIPSAGGYVTRDRFSCVWMRTYSAAVYQCPSDPKPVTLPFQVAGNGGQMLAQLDDGSMVIPSFGRLAIGRPSSFHVITMANGYPSSASLLVGKDSSIWISSANGLFVLPSRSIIEYWTQRDGLDGNTWSILPVGTKTFAISGDNIETLDKDRNRWRILRAFAGATHLMAGPRGTILASSRTQGVVQMDVVGRVLRRSDPSLVMMLAQAPDMQIWSTGDDVSRVNISGAGLVLEPLKALLPQGGGTDIKVDKDGDLLACYAGGLLWGRPGDWHRFSRENGLLADDCLSLSVGRGGDIWYGSDGIDLIQRPRSAHPEIKHVVKPGEMGVGPSYFLGTDSQKRIWRGTSSGVYVTDPEQGKRGQWFYLNRNDGLPGVDTNRRSFFADADGSVWFGIDSTIVHIFPSADFVHPSYAPSVFISGFSWNGGGFEMVNRPERTPHGTPLTAHFGSLQMDRRNALEFRYRLGSDGTSWTTGSDFEIHLRNLSWGRHRLELQGRLGDGPWSQSSIAAFEVARPIWFSVPSAVGFAFVSSFAIAGGARWRKKRQKRMQMPLPGLATWRSAALASDLQSLEGALLDGRFKMSQVIARGGFGTVWRASDRQQQGQPCAVKVFRRELLDNAWMTKRFQQEVTALERVRHPNVVRIYGHGTVSGGAPYLVMEFVEGETLREKLKSGRLTNHQTAGYLRQTAAALAEIHLQGICHRDVKPENLMIRRNAAPGTELVLIDFSIAIVQDPDETVHGLSRAAGTLYYMAPEQAIGYANASSDIYSLAKIVIEMLTGERLSALLPNASIDLSARVRELLIGLHAGLSMDSIDLLASALEFDPSRRPNQAEAFGSAIARDLERAN